ncbi:MAG: glycosyltransferase [Mucilaginibacter sp.]|uniref:glycosyltransferase n=1 Tax=Mucilaginibacter sp. TaxID=1882438 RepID=UPI003265690C
MNISIITCTYNPDERILSKVLDAVRQLVLPAEGNVEYLIIDNNSNPSLSQSPYINNFLNDISWSKLIVETQQGLSYSRLRGFNESTGDIIIFFDDDNVADANYLVEIKQLFKNNVQVGIWGPGNIDVVFTDPVSAWVERSTKGIFQEKHIETVEFGYSLNGASFHPFGTGMALKREIIQFYYDQFVKGGFTTSDRKGNSLASSGDTQLLYAAYKMRLATGVSPGLKMKHLIPGKRTTINYICKLLYGSYSTGDTAFVESFPEYKNRVALPSSKRVLKDIVKKALSVNTLKNQVQFKMDMAAYMGNIIGKYKALDSKEPEWMNKIVNFLKLES